MNSPIKYVEDNFHTIESKQDDCRPYGQQPDGYGRKIAMPYLIRLNESGPWRRVYCVIFSNSGSIYVVVNKQAYYFRHDEDCRIVGQWKRTLAQWSKRYGILPTTPTTEKQAVSVIVNPDSEDKIDLFQLSDYAVSSVCGVVIWLVPR